MTTLLYTDQSLGYIAFKVANTALSLSGLLQPISHFITYSYRHNHKDLNSNNNPELHSPPKTEMNRQNIEISQQDKQNKKLHIIQINLNKSLLVHLDFTNGTLPRDWDIILVQEPYTNPFGTICTPNRFIAIYPESDLGTQEVIRSVIWVNTEISTNNWKALDIPGSKDLTGIQLNGDYRNIMIINIYNCGKNNNTIQKLDHFLDAHKGEINTGPAN